MSNNRIVLIPEDPTFIPDSEKRSEACDWLAKIAPGADEIESEVYEKVEFFDCGANFERILCPFCRSTISIEWWQDRMHEDYRDGFLLARYATPCCNSLKTLHELNYEWPQGFGRFALSAMNPNIGLLNGGYREELERILGTKVRVIYQHI